MKVRLERQIDAPADLVWRVLGTEFASIDNWAGFVKSSRPIEMSEVPPGLAVAPGAPVPGRETKTKVTLVEVLTVYDDEARSLTFHGVGLPPIITLAKDDQTVRADTATTSTVTFDVTMQFRGPFRGLAPLMKRRMAAQFGEILDDLKRHVETVHAAS